MVTQLKFSIGIIIIFLCISCNVEINKKYIHHQQLSSRSSSIIIMFILLLLSLIADDDDDVDDDNDDVLAAFVAFSTSNRPSLTALIPSLSFFKTSIQIFAATSAHFAFFVPDVLSDTILTNQRS